MHKPMSMEDHAARIAHLEKVVTELQTALNEARSKAGLSAIQFSKLPQ